MSGDRSQERAPNCAERHPGCCPAFLQTVTASRSPRSTTICSCPSLPSGLVQVTGQLWMPAGTTTSVPGTEPKTSRVPVQLPVASQFCADRTWRPVTSPLVGPPRRRAPEADVVAVGSTPRLRLSRSPHSPGAGIAKSRRESCVAYGRNSCRRGAVVPLRYRLLCPIRPMSRRSGKAEPAGTAADTSSRRVRRLGAGRSQVQILSPRSATRRVPRGLSLVRHDGGGYLDA